VFWQPPWVQFGDVDFNSWVFSTQTMHNIRGTVKKLNFYLLPNLSIPVLFCLNVLFAWPENGKEPVVFTDAVIWPFLSITLTKIVDRNTQTPFTPKNTKVSKSWLHPSAFHWFLLSSSFIACRLLLLYHKDIFEKCPRMFTMSSTLKHLR